MPSHRNAPCRVRHAAALPGLAGLLVLTMVAVLLLPPGPGARAHDQGPAHDLGIDCQGGKVEEGFYYRAYVTNNGAVDWDIEGFLSTVVMGGSEHVATEADFTAYNRDFYRSDIAERAAKRMEVGLFTTEDNLIEGWEQFQIRFDNMVDHGNDVVCTVVIEDNDFPEVTDISFRNPPGLESYYGMGDRILIDVEFSYPIQIAGVDFLDGNLDSDDRPELTLVFDGDGDDDPVERAATYVGRYPRADAEDGETENRRVTFEYYVLPGDEDLDGITVKALDETGLGERTIAAAATATVKALHDHDEMADLPGMRVDATNTDAISASIVSSPSRSDAYRPGELVRAALVYGDDVELKEDAPEDADISVNLLLGHEDGASLEDSRRKASLQNVVDDTLIFAYEVQPEDWDLNGVELEGDSLLGHDNVVFSNNTALGISNEHPAVSDDDEHPVEGSPYIKSVEVTTDPRRPSGYVLGENIEVTVTYNTLVSLRDSTNDAEPFDDPDLTFPLEIGDGDDAVVRHAGYVDQRLAGFGDRAISSRELVFRYTVDGGDLDTDGLTLPEVSEDDPLGGDARVYDSDRVANKDMAIAAINDYEGDEDLKGHQVDARPYVRSLEVTSEPDNDVAYLVDEDIDIELTLDQRVTVQGKYQLPFQVGPTQDDQSHLRQADYHSGSGSRELVFRYTVVARDLDGDGIRLDVGGESGHSVTGTGSITAVDSGDAWPLGYSVGSGDSGDLSDHQVFGFGVPHAPTGLTVTAGGSDRLDLSWTAPDPATSKDVSGYRIESSADGETWSELEEDTDSTGTSYQHTDLSPTQTVHYRVSAINVAGTGAASAAASGVTDEGQPPGVPRDVKAKAPGFSRVTLSWKKPESRGSSVITGYRLEVSEDGGDTWSDLVADTENRNRTYVNAGLSEGTTRHYRVSAINAAGTGPASEAVSATTISCGTSASAPGNVLGASFVRVTDNGTPVEDNADRVSSEFIVRLHFTHPTNPDRPADVVDFTEDSLTVTGGEVTGSRYRSDDARWQMFFWIEPDLEADSVDLSVPAGTVREDSCRGNSAGSASFTVATPLTVELSTEADEPVTGDDFSVKLVFSHAVRFDPGNLEVDTSSMFNAGEDVEVDNASLGEDVGVVSGTVVNLKVETRAGFQGTVTVRVPAGVVAKKADELALNTAASLEVSVDRRGPSVSSVSVTSEPGDDGEYAAGDGIEFTVSFDEDVSVTGAPELDFDLGGADRTAEYHSHSGSDVVFRYEVVSGDSDTDGVSVAADSLSLNGGSIDDVSGNAADLDHDAVSAQSGHQVSAAGGL